MNRRSLAAAVIVILTIGSYSAFAQTPAPNMSFFVTSSNPKGGNLGGLYRMGWTKDTVRTGDKITMEIHPLRDGTPGGQIVRVTRAVNPLR